MFPNELLDVFVLVGIGFHMGSVNKQHIRLHKTVPSCLLQNAHKDRLKHIRVLETTNVILAGGKEVRNRLAEVVADKPPVSYVGFNFFDRLAHGPNAE